MGSPGSLIRIRQGTLPMSLAELTEPSAVELAMREYETLGRTAFLARYGFGRSREYMLRSPTGQLYDSKAIVGAAFGFQHPDRGPLVAAEFSGGETTVQRRLEELGFEVVRIGDVWSREEVELAVADYLDMLSLEAKGVPYSKAEHSRQLRHHLQNRSKGSIELKHANISAVLNELELPYITGYKPRSSVQSLLREVVREAVMARRDALVRVLDDLQEVRTPAGANYTAVLVDRPDGLPVFPRNLGRTPRKLDYAARDETNRRLGREGEHWAVGFEKHRLNVSGRAELAGKVDWVSDRLGDGTGYDIASFELDEATRYIEVKTTNGGPQTPFVVSANEVAFSREVGEMFFLYRIFEFRDHPQVFMLRGDLTESLSLIPMDYRARLKAL